MKKAVLDRKGFSPEDHRRQFWTIWLLLFCLLLCVDSVSLFGEITKVFCRINKWLLLSHNGDCFKCNYFIILCGSYMQCSVLFNVMQLMYVMLALFCITMEQN